MRSYSRAIGRPGYRDRNTRNATATGMTATQNELVVTPRLASALRSMIDSSGSSPSFPTRSNRRPRWARSPSGRARSSRPNAVTAAHGGEQAEHDGAQPDPVAGHHHREHEDRGGEGDDAADVRAEHRGPDDDEHRHEQPDGRQPVPGAPATARPRTTASRQAAAATMPNE